MYYRRRFDPALGPFQSQIVLNSNIYQRYEEDTLRKYLLI